MTQSTPNPEQAIVAGGCFWCTEAFIRDLKGVQLVESGYIGGHTPNPDYRSICTGQTGHAEAVRVTYDPNQITFRDLLHVFFATHDPTTLNRQGADKGTQYRSAIFPQSAQQEAEAKQVMAELTQQQVFSDPIVTTIEHAPEFYKAEEEHQDFFARNPAQPYCVAVITPKLAKLRQEYGEKLK